ncbi:MAG: RnfABCDGE type electron transport complex subunit D [Candidatus Brocadiia bacterium]|nr:MAG: RnfABCDGE type electron transport complex subunit D [Candidatus Brocadiia bacterium]
MLKDIRVSCSPHISGGFSTRGVMADVLIGLIPAIAASYYFFRMHAVILICTCIISSLITEVICNKIRGKEKPWESLGDLSAIVTGIILAFSVPATLPVWAAVTGSVFAIGIGKMVFGGLGANIFNPAMVGRAFLMASFGILMTTWMVPITIDPAMSMISADNELDARTQATPLSWSKQAIKSERGAEDVNNELKASFWGNTGGCLGETSGFALIIGGFYLLIRRTINFHIPLAVLLSAFIFALIAYLIDPDSYISPWLHLLNGGLLLCTFFIATDPVTAPLSRKGMWIFGIGVGSLTMLIRILGEYPEGVMFAILLMNSVTPLIDRFCKLTPAGGKPNVK